MPTAVVIVAAGRGSRATDSPDGLPKQYQDLAGTPVITRTVMAFVGDPRVHILQVVVHSDAHALYETALGPLRHRCCRPVNGGVTRQESVLAGLEALALFRPRRVLIHDAARPFVSSLEISRLLSALDTAPAAISALPVTDTLKRQQGDGAIGDTVERKGIWRALTPQGFHYELILAAHRAAAAAGKTDFTDDAAVATWAGIPVLLVEGSAANTKLTTMDDIAQAARSLLGKGEVRTGTGFDVHRFAPGDGVWLCGIRVPHTHKLDGHSDADVGLHALTDAILGALAAGDIGQHFPPSDMKWKDAASYLFLEDAARRVAEKNGRIANVDVTLLCESPKIAPHRAAMRAAIAGFLGIEIGRVGVKATTTEGLGFTGRREGIAAMASATIMLAN